MSRTVAWPALGWNTPHWDYESRNFVNGEWTVPCGRGFGTDVFAWEAACAHIAEHCGAPFHTAEELPRPCPHGDPSCPCQDGDPCHYEDDEGPPATAALACEHCGTAR